MYFVVLLPIFPPLFYRLMICSYECPNTDFMNSKTEALQAAVTTVLVSNAPARRGKC